MYCLFFACSKDSKEGPDYRDPIIGIFHGIGVKYELYPPFPSDTIQIEAFLSKSAKDSMVELTFDPWLSGTFEFQYLADSLLKSTKIGHRPTIKLLDSTMIFHYQPGLGPVFYHAFLTKK